MNDLVALGGEGLAARRARRKGGAADQAKGFATSEHELSPDR
jgi:hypothetical protein